MASSTYYCHVLNGESVYIWKQSLKRNKPVVFSAMAIPSFKPCFNTFGKILSFRFGYLKKLKDSLYLITIRGSARDILGDTGADSGGEGKSKRAEKYGLKKSKERREEPLGTMSYRSLLFFEPYFSARLDFPSPPLSAPGSPRMCQAFFFIK